MPIKCAKCGETSGVAPPSICHKCFSKAFWYEWPDGSVFLYLADIGKFYLTSEVSITDEMIRSGYLEEAEIGEAT